MAENQTENKGLDLNKFEENIGKVASEKVDAAKADLTTTIEANKTETSDSFTKMQGSIDTLAEKFDTFNINTNKAKSITLADMMTTKESKEGFDALKNKEINAFEIKLDTESDIYKTLSYGGTGESVRVPQEHRDLNIQTDPHYQTSVAANLVNMTAANRDIVRYIRENSPTNSASGKAKGAAFAEKTVDLRNYSEEVITIGEFITLNSEALSDVAMLRSFINMEFMGDLRDLVDQYILSGTGSANNQLNGFDQTGQHTAWADNAEFTTTGANNIDVLMAGLSQLESTNYKGDLIVCSPASFWGANFSLAKSSQNEYTARQILQAAQNGVTPMIGGARIVRSNAVTGDKFFILDTKKAAKLWTVEGTSIEFAYNGDDFKNNQVSGRIKCRKALTVGRPKGVIYGDFSDARTALNS